MESETYLHDISAVRHAAAMLAETIRKHVPADEEPAEEAAEPCNHHRRHARIDYRAIALDNVRMAVETAVGAIVNKGLV